MPSSDGSYRMLVTDSNGNATWADRTLYATTSPEIAIVENVSVTTESDYGTICCTDITTKFIIGETYRVVFDDATYDNLICNQSEEEYVCIGGEIWTTGDETCPFTLTTSEYIDGIEVRALIEGAHTFSLYHKKENTVMVGQPNWEQNDPLAVDYIKGRTHYSYVVPGETIAENVAVTTELEYSTYCCEDVTTKFVLGTTYKVIFDGITYDNITCNQSDSEYVCVGGEIWTDGDDTYPFTMTTSEYMNGIEVRATTAGEHTFSVYSYDMTKYVGIPDEYLKRDEIYITEGANTFKLSVSSDGYLYLEDDDGRGIFHRIATEEDVNNNSPNDDHINALIDAKLGVIENGTY